MALGKRQFQSQLELRAMIVRTMSDLDPIAAEKAPFRALLVMDQLTCTRSLFLVSFDPS